MKQVTIKSMTNFALIGMAAVVIGACSVAPGQVETVRTEPQRIVVETPPEIEMMSEEFTVAVNPNEVESAPGETVQLEQARPVPEEAGTLLKGSGDGVFYLTETGVRQHIYNWDTFLAFGFAPEEIVEVDDETLAAIPLAGELTRLVQNEQGRLYWVSNGKRWMVERWKPVVTQADYLGIPVTHLDPSLQANLPVRAQFRRGTLLRDGGQVYYYWLGYVTPAPKDVDLSDVMDVPPGVLATYTQKMTIDRVFGQLNANTEAANLRSGPGLNYDVLDVIKQSNGFRANGQTADGAWLAVIGRDQAGWLAADLVEPNLELSLLPVIAAVPEPVIEEAPAAQPAALTESEASSEVEDDLQPIYCTEVPIRGFGKVWGDHLEVQQRLSCPSTWAGGERGTQAAVQTFQYGLMLWLESDSVQYADPVYVFFNDGSYQRFGDLGSADPEKVGTTPTGFFAVGDKFSKVYWEGTGARVKERLGYATSDINDSAGAFQQFYNGRMFWAETIDEIFVIYDYSYYDKATERSIRVRAWESYEDKF